jgi:phosphoribosylcarboxyaminoimidazole (NCAIR) mutase
LSIALARAIVLKRDRKPHGKGVIVVVSAGTSDIPVAEEAVVTAELMGNNVQHIYDVGVAGIHRLLAHRGALAKARVIVVCAGMEGALPSVVGGLVGVPVIAVPTSVGYGAAFEGLAALLGMMNSCASNVSVVLLLQFRVRHSARRGNSRLNNEVSSCRKLCNSRIPLRSPLSPKTRFCSAITSASLPKTRFVPGQRDGRKSGLRSQPDRPVLSA